MTKVKVLRKINIIHELHHWLLKILNLPVYFPLGSLLLYLHHQVHCQDVRTKVLQPPPTIHKNYKTHTWLSCMHHLSIQYTSKLLSTSKFKVFSVVYLENCKTCYNTMTITWQQLGSRTSPQIVTNGFWNPYEGITIARSYQVLWTTKLLVIMVLWLSSHVLLLFPKHHNTTQPV